MKKFEEYTVEECTAIALCDGEDESCRQNALLITSTEESGEVVEKLVFGWAMPESDEDWRDMCEDTGAWEMLSEEHHKA